MSTQWPLFTLPCFHSCRMSYSETLKYSSAEGFHCMFRPSALPLSLAKVIFVFYYFYVCLKKVKLTVCYYCFYHKWLILQSSDLTKNLLHSDKHTDTYTFTPETMAQRNEHKTRQEPRWELEDLFVFCGCFSSVAVVLCLFVINWCLFAAVFVVHLVIFHPLLVIVNPTLCACAHCASYFGSCWNVFEAFFTFIYSFVDFFSL